MSRTYRKGRRDIQERVILDKDVYDRGHNTREVYIDRHTGDRVYLGYRFESTGHVNNRAQRSVNKKIVQRGLEEYYDG